MFEGDRCMRRRFSRSAESTCTAFGYTVAAPLMAGRRAARLTVQHTYCSFRVHCLLWLPTVGTF